MGHKSRRQLGEGRFLDCLAEEERKGGGLLFRELTFAPAPQTCWAAMRASRDEGKSMATSIESSRLTWDEGWQG